VRKASGLTFTRASGTAAEILQRGNVVELLTQHRTEGKREGIAPAGMGSGEVGSGIVPVLAQWLLGDSHQPVEQAHA